MTIVTPMMRQYQAVKEQYSDCLLFFRLGDFYEMFGEDALTASRELNIVLTARDGGQGQKVAMCGVPHHAADNYIARLIGKGYKVAICEQLEDPKLAKGIVRRDVIRIVTPGTVLEENMLQVGSHNYLAACWPETRRGAESGFGLAYVDISSGEFRATELKGPECRKELGDELVRINPAELVLPEALAGDELFRFRSSAVVSRCPEEGLVRNSFEDLLRIHFRVASLEGLGLQDRSPAARAVAMILLFLQQTQKRSLNYLDRLTVYDCGEYMFLDAATRRNLELTATIRGNKRQGSLLSVVDHTQTAMGSRLLREWLESPLLDCGAVNRRLDAVSELINQPLLLDDFRLQLPKLYDLPRLVGRVCYGSAGPRELAALRSTLSLLPELFRLLSQLNSPLAGVLLDSFDLLEDIDALLRDALADEPPLSARDHGAIRSGFNSEVDELRRLSGSAKELLLQMEAEEREKTGIRNLKVGFNKVFGYYIEISKSRAAEAPDRYLRKQTLANGERYITEELKELENRILSAGERLSSLEYQLFMELRQQVAEAATRILATADVLAHLDVLQGLAHVAIHNCYCRPQVDGGGRIIIKEGRHPVVESILGAENYIPNDTYLDKSSQRMMLITGPNMAGKSTYMRQVALVVLLAQIGSFVPAAAAQIGTVDRIFTRVGAADDLTAGQSTFMVEMNETSNILRHAGPKSLIVLDEIGRGTSTFDGLSIAWAVAEYIVNDACGAKTLFATHYHELTALADTYPLIRNFSIAVREKGKDIIFLRKIVEGAEDKSYGIQVAQLAGLPKAVLARAREILAQLEKEKHPAGDIQISEQLTFDTLIADDPPPEPALLRELRELDTDAITPLDALLTIIKWKKELL